MLADRGIFPDFQFSSLDKNTDLDFIHRRTDHEEIYFIRNKRDEAAKFNASFRVKDKTPELWLPDTGERVPQLVYHKTANGISFEIDLDIYGSVFVVFTSEGNNNHLKSITGNNTVNDLEGEKISITSFENGNFEAIIVDNDIVKFTVDNIPDAIEVTGEWEITFTEDWGAQKSIKTKQLISLSEFDDIGINYYSGITHYQSSFNIPKGHLGKQKKLFLDLGNLWLLADVTVNGKYLGTLWKAPYCIDISNAVKPGVNKLEVEVANTWSNRLIGDARHPDEKQYCQTNITVTETEGIPWKDAPLRKSGLFGPVKLISAINKTLSISE